MHLFRGLTIALVTMVLSSGCANMHQKVEKEAFGSEKRFALISVFGPDEISGRQERNIAGMIASMSSEKGYTHDAVPTMTRSVKAIEKAFSKAHSFKLVSSKSILSSQSYKQAKGEALKIALWTMSPATGFKTFGEKTQAEITSIIKENRLEGAILVSLTYTHGSDGVAGVGKSYGFVNMAVTALDRTGNRVWSDFAQLKSDEGTFTLTGAADFTKLDPILVVTTEKAAAELVAKLDRVFSGK